MGSYGGDFELRGRDYNITTKWRLYLQFFVFISYFRFIRKLYCNVMLFTMNKIDDVFDIHILEEL